MRHNIILPLVLHILWSSTLFANVGFNHSIDEMPSIFQQLSKRVFMVHSDRHRSAIGTAFLVFNDGRKSVFITARHVLYDVHPKQLKDMVTRLSLHQGGYWESGVNSRLTSEYSVRPTEIGALQDVTPDWKFSGRASDIGYFIANSHPDSPLVNLEMSLGKSLKHQAIQYLKIKNYILGYPALQHRDEAGSWVQSMRISLSQGEILHREDKNKKFILHSTADSRGGSSGSPVFTEDGQLIGVLSGGGKSDRYVSYRNGMNSAIVPVDYVRSMIGNLLLKRRTNMASSAMCLWFYR